MLPGNPSAIVGSVWLMSSEGVLPYSKKVLLVLCEEMREHGYKTTMTRVVDMSIRCVIADCRFVNRELWRCPHDVVDQAGSTE